MHAMRRVCGLICLSSLALFLMMQYSLAKEVSVTVIGAASDLDSMACRSLGRSPRVYCVGHAPRAACPFSFPHLFF